MTDPYSYPYAAPHYSRAAVAVWTSAGLLLIFSVCCVSLITMLAVIPVGELKQMDEAGDVSAEDWNQLAQAQPYMPAMALATAVFTILPAVALIVLGFYVRGGRRGAAVTAQVICWVPFGLVILQVVLSLPSVPTAGAAGILGLLPSLALGGVLFWAIKSLRQAQRTPAPAAYGTPGTPPRGVSPDDDPWEHLL
ncbi:MAG: hypothetical protein AAF333_12690 [Planctomycetota bacterium]